MFLSVKAFCVSPIDILYCYLSKILKYINEQFILLIKIPPSHVITIRNEVAQVMFLHLPVILFTGGSASVHSGIPHPPGTRHPPQTRHPPWDQAPLRSRDGYCCGQYASYWNAFLLILVFNWFFQTRTTLFFFPCHKDTTAHVGQDSTNWLSWLIPWFMELLVFLLI